MKIRWLEPILKFVVPRMAVFYLLLMGRSTRLKIISACNRESRTEVFDWKKGVIYCCWHSRFLYYGYYGRRTATYAMISQSRDGELISRTIGKLGMGTIRGSSSKNGSQAFEQAVEHLKQNGKLLITPDGPRGPRHTVKHGVIRLAQRTGCPILPVAFSSTKGLFFPSWDRFFLPLPFGKGVFTMGEPIYIPANISEQEVAKECQNLEKVMRNVCQRADQECGRDPEKEVLKNKKKRK